ncbi:MAG: hypothetical protein U0270_15495 [Labilithrix sp.]
MRPSNLSLSLLAIVLTSAFGCVSPGEDAAPTAAAEIRAEARPLAGLYLNTFSGPLGGTEWFEVIPLPEVGRYRFADLFGGGFDGSLDAQGTIVLDGGIGGGRVIGADSFALYPRLGSSSFVFSSVRAPRTDASIVRRLDTPPSEGDAALAGTYLSETEALDPRTGASLGVSTEALDIAIDGTSFRMTDPHGLYFQGVFTSDDAVGIRAITPEPADPRFRSFAGSSTNTGQNAIGSVRIVDRDHFAATVLLQSKTPLGSQTQRAFRFSATRAGAPSSTSDRETPPVDSADSLDAWLARGAYRGWRCETSAHPSRPPSGHAQNRICSNLALSEHGGGEFPVGAVSVKELFDDSGTTVTGHAVAVKVAPGAGGAAWYWYEKVDGRLIAAGTGDTGTPKTVCTRCHARAGAATFGHDMVFTQVGPSTEP